MEPVKAAAVQATPALLDRDATLANVVALCEKAAAEGARLVAFPEAFVPGYPDWVWRTRPWDATASSLYAHLLDQAVVIGPAAAGVLAETARRLGIWLSVGADERDETGSTLCNSLLHFAPDGALAARHRKLMPTGGERLIWHTGDGSTLDIIDTGCGRLGGLICWENYMPLARFHLYAQGIEVWIAPTLAPATAGSPPCGTSPGRTGCSSSASTRCCTPTRSRPASRPATGCSRPPTWNATAMAGGRQHGHRRAGRLRTGGPGPPP